MMENSKGNTPRNSDAVARTTGKTSTASGDRKGRDNAPGPSVIGGNDKTKKKVTLFTVLLLLVIGQLKSRLQNPKKLATEPCVQCIFFSTYYLVYFICTKTEHLDKNNIIEQSLALLYGTKVLVLIHYFSFLINKNNLKQIDHEPFNLELNYRNPHCDDSIYFKLLGHLDINHYFYEYKKPLSLQAGSKRPVDEKILDDSKNQSKKRRGEAPRLRYADVARAGNIMIEIRASNPKVQLGQPDFDNIEHKMAMAYVNLPSPRPTQMPKIFQMGLSQGGMWIGAKDEYTLEFMLIHVPCFLMPPGTGTYTYQVYGPENRPYKYFKTTVPVRFWGCRLQLEDIILAFHPQLQAEMLDRYGNPKYPHLRISAGMENPEEIVGGYFPITIETDELLGPELGRLGGILTILSTKLRLVGGGIEQFIADAKAPRGANGAAGAPDGANDAAGAPTIELNDDADDHMDHQDSHDIPLAPPPPPPPSTPAQPGLIPPLPSLKQMRPRTPSPRSSPQHE